MRNNLVETLMGAIVLVIASSFLYFAFSHSGVSTNGGKVYIAKFDKIDGLSVGSDVKISGIKVGTIVDQYLDTETFYAVVQISIDPKIKLTESTFAKITSEGLLGGNYLVLDPGSEDDIMLEEGDEIPNTQGSVDLLNLLDKFAGSDKGKE
ncbi:outer membrane lipid asymmetry maintenance protein MlaD [Paremcibacter congregatus]|uniref:Outer membrane lipid asymmetry maintenance protein MlaD n=1 Tax=Paremcibacter congregatus TaxID=2043170 RepID=A0A2G4YNC3_9PROT|nr:outer membrane lipid asymmetry maintenance protein MlaD [Paremcibacter congregatus]PHZ83783.1 outer membrane lipid asymmetry maintenance protein MlaD [Paremcibacter congregatus]QDE27487.1 outer membrane lipid asymmetry maintenance protein MlaD [Paremcibacter congregatus]